MRFVRPENTDRPILTEVLKKSQGYFSKLKQQWDPIRDQFFNTEHLQHIFEQLPDLSGRIVLDAGSATGMVALNAALKAQTVIALDLNGKFVHHLQQIKKTLSLNNLFNIQADLRKAPIRAESIDVIFTVLVLHHLPQPQKWFKTAFQILNSRGLQVVVEFERHFNKQLADTMHDLWLGFQPSLIKRWASENDFKLKISEQWLSKSGVPVRWFLFTKM
ncbi:MAG TPA: class I SAM-dependent methyltransferase [Caldithrix abyssi]|uniref:Class I SAM-dependent methyltransferase n=1 Tax=Caldithrix abyssi TaxID=187145 RepID=A0A7V5LIN6_CALAY|nr:class I SAM-dependent methyltransferase [Caldithrix abyssi]